MCVYFNYGSLSNASHKLLYLVDNFPVLNRSMCESLNVSDTSVVHTGVAERRIPSASGACTLSKENKNWAVYRNFSGAHYTLLCATSMLTDCFYYTHTSSAFTIRRGLAKACLRLSCDYGSLRPEFPGRWPLRTGSLLYFSIESGSARAADYLSSSLRAATATETSLHPLV